MRKRRTESPGELRLGVHTSIAGSVSRSVERAAALGCTTMQIFSHNPRQWAEAKIPREEAAAFADLRKEHGIKPVFVHASYLINLASLNAIVRERSIRLLSYELENADALEAEYVVLHTGSASGDDEQKARARAVTSLIKSLSAGRFRARILLENTAGERGDITSSVKALAEIVDACHHDGIGGICLDTCHAFASGYDLRAKEGLDHLLHEIDEHVGIGGLKLIHLNDSKRPFGSGVDRHEHICKGHIGLKGFRNLLGDDRILRTPLVLETPKSTEEDDARNLRKVRSLIRRA